jgi:glycosyltransferase involved in cell wall biosynthesis
MNRILFHSLTIPPDQVSTGKLVADVASKFKEKNFNIEILASTPQYRFDSKKFSDEGLNKTGKNKYVSYYKDVKITHLSSSKRSFSRVKRFSQWINYHLKSINYLIGNRNNFDTIFIFSYPPTMNLIAIFTKKILKKKTIYSIWELYPEIAQKLNELNSKFLLNSFKKVDNFCLQVIDEVVVNSDEMKQYLIDVRKINADKISVVYHFANEKETPKSPKITKEIMYAGNLGTPQNVESFLDLYSLSEKQYKLTIYGSGSQFDSIVGRESLNINVNSFVSRDELLQKTNHIPFALVSLSPKITVEGFPGKTFDYLKMNKILIGYSNPNSSLAKFIEKYELGINISPNEDNLDSKLKTLENKEYIDQIYKNISKVNNKFANVDTIADQYIKLI